MAATEPQSAETKAGNRWLRFTKRTLLVLHAVSVVLMIAAHPSLSHSQGVPFPYQTLSPSDSKTHEVPLTAEQRTSDLKELHDVFASVDALPPKGARWVEVATGAAASETRYHGWLLRESTSDIQLLTEYGRKETFDKRKLAAKKPVADFQGSDVRTIRDSQFEKFCRDGLRVDTPNSHGNYSFATIVQ